MKTVAGVFASIADAEKVARQMEGFGIPRQDINIVAGNDAHRHDEYLKKAKSGSEGTASAAASAASFGGGVGILAGLAALIIPGVGPIIAGGALATVLTGLGIGAAAGGLVGAFVNMGISHDEAGLYEEAVRRGNIVLAAQVDDPLEPEVVQLMDEHGARDIKEEAKEWRAAGWTHAHPSDSSIVSHTPAETLDSGSRARSYPYERSPERGHEPPVNDGPRE
jgi:hypothetical protein